MRDALDAFAADLLAGARVAGTSCVGGVLRLEVAALEPAPDAVRRRALLAALREAGCPPAQLSRRHVLAVDALIVDWRGQGRLDLPGGVGGGARLWEAGAHRTRPSGVTWTPQTWART